MLEKDLKTKTKDELEGILSKKRSELSKKRLDFLMGKFKNTNEVRYLKRDIARIKTFISEKIILTN